MGVLPHPLGPGHPESPGRAAPAPTWPKAQAGIRLPLSPITQPEGGAVQAQGSALLRRCLARPQPRAPAPPPQEFNPLPTESRATAPHSQPAGPSRWSKETGGGGKIPPAPPPEPAGSAPERTWLQWTHTYLAASYCIGPPRAGDLKPRTTTAAIKSSKLIGWGVPGQSLTCVSSCGHLTTLDLAGRSGLKSYLVSTLSAGASPGLVGETRFNPTEVGKNSPGCGSLFQLPGSSPALLVLGTLGLSLVIKPGPRHEPSGTPSLLEAPPQGPPSLNH
ncbi:uncharacterized protein LOC115899084 [Rhinopithecus roxellana]|uniref:uncharacterized protein LOC115899084 n=1 Tax=Rhinopithecus roxellana TaxID=61622 RepID=UPI00123778AC|nr:uncharacterized protein LOC115899084 [Rhinopithecus roxellana]